ncbi:hypothetical protein ACTNE0_02025 [Bacillota bacterium HCP3S3_E9]
MVEIIPAEEKSKLGMNLAGRNHPCGESSLREKFHQQGMKLAGENHP